MTYARILLVGVLAIAAMALISSAIIHAAPYLAILIVVAILIGILWRISGIPGQ